VPVLTGIGHTGDVSVADLVAARSFRTPTACGEGLAAIVREWYAERVAEPSARAVQVAVAMLDEAVASIDQSRRQLGVVGRQRLGRADDALAARTALLARRAPLAVESGARRCASRAQRVGPLAVRSLSAALDAMAARRALLAAYDPARLMARGWSITSDEHGEVLRTIAGLEPGTTIVTRLADGVARSTLTEVTGQEGTEAAT
jgi:exodeoxyribonuclease VII large subunit